MRRSTPRSPHGLEVLNLRASSDADAPPLCPITGPRLQAQKLLGDPNVPALRCSWLPPGGTLGLGVQGGQRPPMDSGTTVALFARACRFCRRYSFVADAASCRLGPYDRATDDPFAPGGGPARPCLAFFEAAVAVVGVEARPVAARFRAGGRGMHMGLQWQAHWGRAARAAGRQTGRILTRHTHPAALLPQRPRSTRCPATGTRNGRPPRCCCTTRPCTAW